MPAIKVSGVTKSYRAGVGRARVREMLPPPLDRATKAMFPRWWSKDSFNALEDIDLEVSSGSSVGILGHNGAGKTTLLKIIAGITDPTEGRVSVEGRTAALIDVVVGFNIELTGRENAYLLGAIYRLSRKQMTSLLPEIFDFAEIGELIDTPLKRYSAGMVARLGFGITTALDPEVLLVDEVLSVGDAAFQRRCVDWLDTFRKRGGTLVCVSHNLALIRSMTERVLWIDHGRAVGEGQTEEMLTRYARASERRVATTAPIQQHWDAGRAMLRRGLHRWGAGGARIEEVHVSEVSPSSALDLEIVVATDDVPSAYVSVGFVDEQEREVGSATSPLMPLSHGRGSLICRFDPVPLRAGIYFPVIAIVSDGGVVRDRWQLDRAVVVESNGSGHVEGLGPVDLSASWVAGDASYQDVPRIEEVR